MKDICKNCGQPVSLDETKGVWIHPLPDFIPGVTVAMCGSAFPEFCGGVNPTMSCVSSGMEFPRAVPAGGRVRVWEEERLSGCLYRAAVRPVVVVEAVSSCPGMGLGGIRPVETGSIVFGVTLLGRVNRRLQRLLRVQPA